MSITLESKKQEKQETPPLKYKLVVKKMDDEEIFCVWITQEQFEEVKAYLSMK